MPSNEEEIQRLRELERSIVNDLQNANKLVEIKSAVSNEEIYKDIRSAGIHCLRRILLELAENEIIQRGKAEHYSSNNKSKSTKKSGSKVMKIYEWFVQQYEDVQSTFCQLLSTKANTWSHALVIRTYLELLKIDHKIYENSFPLEHIVPDTNFALSSYRTLLLTLLNAPFGLDVDLLIMLKDEIFTYHDCLYFGYYLLHEILVECKEEANELQIERQVLFSAVAESVETTTTKKKGGKKTDQQTNANNKSAEQEQFLTKEKAYKLKKKNLLDLLRMMQISKDMFSSDADQTNKDDDDDTTSKYLIPFEWKSESNRLHDANDDDSDSEAEVEQEKKIIEDEQMTLAKQKKLLKTKKFTSTSSNTTTGTTPSSVNKKLMKKDFQYQLLHYSSYQKLFSKNWILLLSLHWTIQEHKILLTHLSTYIMKELSNPLLLADYLTECYQFGGIIAILSLENLLTLILNYNLDYPNFFYSLYALCNSFILQSKYSYKFLSLLSLCLKSSNIPEIMIFSFMKRLAFIALHSTSNKVIYCVRQMMWLLKQYRNTQQLIHKKKEKKASHEEGEGEEETEVVNDQDDGEEGEDRGGEEGKANKKKRLRKEEKKKVEENEAKSSNKRQKIGQSNSHTVGFIVEEEKDLMNNHVKESSLYELELLEHHYLYKHIAQVTSTIRNAATTSIHAIPLDMKQYTNISLQTLIDKEFEEMKKSNYDHCELAFKKPNQLFV